MGNRCVCVFDSEPTIGLYLHWNGSKPSIEAALRCMRRYKVRSGDYGIARFSQVFMTFIGGSLSVGIGTLENLDTEGDNGIFYIDTKRWVITGRKTQCDEHEDSVYEDEVFEAMCKACDGVFGYEEQS